MDKSMKTEQSGVSAINEEDSKKENGANVLITGGAGFIGSNLALKLIDMGYTVTVLDNLSPQIHGADPETTSELYKSIKNKVKFICGDVCDKNILKTAIEGQDYIFHLAAETGTGQSMYEVEKYFVVNVQATANLVDTLGNNKHQVKKVLVSSSRAVYGEGKYLDDMGNACYPRSRFDIDMQQSKFELLDPETKVALKLVATDETAKKNPVSVYGMTKQYQEEIIMNLLPNINVIPVALRYQNVYGPGQSLSNPYTGILAVFSTRILNGNDIAIFEDGLESRDFVYIDDVVDATIMAMFNEKANNQIFNVGTGVATNVITIAEKLRELYESNVKIEITGKYRIGDIRHNYADLTKIKTMLGFSPGISFEKGLANFVAWVKTQPVQKDSFDKSINEMKAKGLFKG